MSEEVRLGARVNRRHGATSWMASGLRLSIPVRRIRAAEGRDLDVAADGADLVRERGELDVGDELQALAERAEEIVVVGRDDRSRVQLGQDPSPVVVAEAVAGDAGEEDVDVALAQRLVEEVGAALVVEAQPGDGDRDAPDLPQR